MSRLIHKTPCPRAPLAAPTYPDTCACPPNWPKYEDDLLREAAEAVKKSQLPAMFASRADIDCRTCLRDVILPIVELLPLLQQAVLDLKGAKRDAPCPNCRAIESCCEASRARLETANSLQKLVDRMQRRKTP